MRDERLGRARAAGVQRHARSGSCRCRSRRGPARGRRPAPRRGSVSRSFSIAGLEPISRRITTLPSESSRRSARVSSVRARASPPRWQSSASRSGSNGFSTKSKAPIRIASTAIGTSPWPVIRITGRPGSIDCSRRSSAMPSMPGMRMSLITTPAKSGPMHLQRRLGRVEGDRLEARELQPLRHALAHVDLVVDDGDLGFRSFDSASCSLCGLRLSPAARQHQLEDRAAVGGVAGDEPPAELGREAGRDGEAEAEALAGFLGGVEGLEELVGLAQARRRCPRSTAGSSRPATSRILISRSSRPRTASSALRSRLTMICSIRSGSACTTAGSEGSVVTILTDILPSCGAIIDSAARTLSRRSTGSMSTSPLRA